MLFVSTGTRGELNLLWLIMCTLFTISRVAFSLTLLRAGAGLNGFSGHSANCWYLVQVAAIVETLTAPDAADYDNVRNARLENAAHPSANLVCLVARFGVSSLIKLWTSLVVVFTIAVSARSDFTWLWLRLALNSVPSSAIFTVRVLLFLSRLTSL